LIKKFSFKIYEDDILGKLGNHCVRDWH